MVKIKNINRSHDYIECDYYPEGNMNLKCHVKIDANTKKPIECIVNGKTDERQWGFSHVVKQLERYLEADTIVFPDEKILLWY